MTEIQMLPTHNHPQTSVRHLYSVIEKYTLTEGAMLSAMLMKMR